MNTNSKAPQEDRFVLVGTRVTRSTQERFKELAERDHRTVSGELRRLIEQRVADADDPIKEAA